MKEEYLKKEWWERFPGATHFSPSGENTLAVFWRFDEDGSTVEVWVIHPGGFVDNYYPHADCCVPENLIKRPESFPEEDISTSYTPSTGEECLAFCWDDFSATSFQKVRFIAEDDNEMVFRWLHSGSVVASSKEYCAFKPLPKEPTMKELVLEKWRRQGLDYAYDGVDTDVELGHAIDFLLAYYHIEEK